MSSRTPLRAALLIAVLAAALSAAPAAAAARPALSVTPTAALDIPFRWGVSDYALRCGRGPVSVRIRGARGWRASVNGAEARGGSFKDRIRVGSGRRSVVLFSNGRRHRRFHLRCLPNDFPEYEFHRFRPGGPAFTLMQLDGFYAAIFNADGVPVWWLKADGAPYNFQLLPSGRLALIPADGFTFQVRAWELYSLNGRLVGKVGYQGPGTADVHELFGLPNGNYLIGRRVVRDHVDTRPWGPADASVVDIEVQEITPGGRVRWSWNSADHISLTETGRWWNEPILQFEPYDIVHWNSIEPMGKRYLLLSFRHLDAVYKIDRRTGKIVWKFGGTPTAKSLDVRGDPHGDYPLGGQHDARLLPDGTVSIFDNRTGLPGRPRVVRYRIDGPARTARLVQSFSERAIPVSVCCGSARRLGHSWLVGWGGYPDALIGAYDLRGRRRFTLQTDRFTYRANYATSKQLSMRRLRRGMDAIARRGAAG
jgi:hypothetical protein